MEEMLTDTTSEEAVGVAGGVSGLSGNTEVET